MKKTKTSFKIPEEHILSKDEIIDIYKEELKRKDEIISTLEKENKLLLELSIKNTKKRLEELSEQMKPE